MSACKSKPLSGSVRRMRTIAIALILFPFWSCQQKPPVSNHHISRVSLTLYSWHWRDSDSLPTLVVNRHIQVDSLNNCRIARRRQWLEPLEYFQSILPPDADATFSSLASTFVDTVYNSGVGGRIDDSFSRALIIERNDGSHAIIRYKPDLLPSSLRGVDQVLDTIMSGNSAVSSPSFDFTEIVKWIAWKDSTAGLFLARPTRGHPVPVKHDWK